MYLSISRRFHWETARYIYPSSLSQRFSAFWPRNAEVISLPIPTSAFLGIKRWGRNERRKYLSVSRRIRWGRNKKRKYLSISQQKRWETLRYFLGQNAEKCWDTLFYLSVSWQIWREVAFSLHFGFPSVPPLRAVPQNNGQCTIHTWL